MIKLEELHDIWSTKRRESVVIHILNIPQDLGDLLWECRINAKNFSVIFSGKTFLETIRKAKRAALSTYFKNRSNDIGKHIIDSDTGNEIRRIRKACKRTQHAFCELLERHGILLTQSYLSELEKGYYQAGKEILERIKEERIEAIYES
jgi:hypothetical protein